MTNLALGLLESPAVCLFQGCFLTRPGVDYTTAIQCILSIIPPSLSVILRNITEGFFVFFCIKNILWIWTRIRIRICINKNPDPHQSDKVYPEPDPDPHQFADDKSKCMVYEPILALLFKGLRIYLEPSIWIRIRIHIMMKNRIRIRIRTHIRFISRIRIRNKVLRAGANVLAGHGGLHLFNV
jgi:hypothetical protein